MKLTCENVDAVIRDCLYKPEEVTDGKAPIDAVIGEGLVRNFVFHPVRLKAHEQDIKDMLVELHPNFKKGWSFLNGCMTKDEDQWGEQPDVEALFALGCGIGAGTWVMKELMGILPGGVPYYQVNI